MAGRYYTIFNLLALSVIIYIGVDVVYKIIVAKLTQFDTTTSVVETVPDDKEHRFDNRIGMDAHRLGRLGDGRGRKWGVDDLGRDLVLADKGLQAFCS